MNVGCVAHPPARSGALFVGVGYSVASADRVVALAALALGVRGRRFPRKPVFVSLADTLA